MGIWMGMCVMCNMCAALVFNRFICIIKCICIQIYLCVKSDFTYEIQRASAQRTWMRTLNMRNDKNNLFNSLVQERENGGRKSKTTTKTQRLLDESFIAKQYHTMRYTQRYHYCNKHTNAERGMSVWAKTYGYQQKQRDKHIHILWHMMIQACSKGRDRNNFRELCSSIDLRQSLHNLPYILA